MSTSSGESKPSFADSSSQLTGFFAWFDRRIAPSLHWFGELPAIVAIREALPWSFIGLLVALLVLVWFVPAAGGTFWQQLAGRVAGALLPALACMSVVLLVLLAIQLSQRLKLPLVPYLAACIVAFGFSLPQPFDSHPLVYLRTLGESGLFLAIVIALVVASVFDLVRRLRRGRRSQSRSSPPIHGGLLLERFFATFKGIRPPGFCEKVTRSVTSSPFVAFCVGLGFLGLFWGHVSLANILFSILQPIARLGDSYGALILIVGIETLLWVAGVHGPAVLVAIVTPVYLTLQTQNSEAFAQHLPLPHIVVISLFLFVFPGGAGATLPLVALLAISRVPRLRTLGRATILPALFNINEPLLFGLPLVFNPYLAVPFIIAPLVLATITYTVMMLGWIARPIYYYPSSIPTVISTYLATLDTRAIILVVLNVLIAGIIYFPFVRAYERHLTEPMGKAGGLKNV